ncbi:MAG: hypothetical protein GXO60_09460, partial [Epsilonproteobacteria bacterium]|nr:hypothetical protein [Campylobacterota bacterium]
MLFYFRLIKQLLLLFLIIISIFNSASAIESTTPNVDILLEVAQDGGIEAGFNDTDPLVDGNGSHTAG